MIWRPDEGTAPPAPPERIRRPTRPSGRAGGGPQRSRGRRILRWALPLGLLLLVADIAVAGLGLAAALQEVRAHLVSARRAVGDGKLADARRDLDRALAAVGDAKAYRRHPGFLVVSPVPDARAVAALVDAADLAARAGHEAMGAAQVLGVEEGGTFAGSLYDHGVLRLESLREARPALQAVDALLGEAAREFDDLPDPSLAPVQDALLEAAQEIRGAAAAAHKGSVLFDALPALFGEGEPRRYLLAFQALGEARATGGLIGYYGILEAADGRLRLLRSAPIDDLPNYFPAVDGPQWFEDTYGAQAALNQTQQVNVSPNFPTIAEVLLRMFEEHRGADLDGVVAMDPKALSHLLDATGPIEVPGSGVTATADNVTEVLLHDSYVDLPSEELQDVFLGRLIEAFWAEIAAGDFEGVKFATGVTEAVATQHLKVYARDEDDQAALEALGADGLYSSAGPNVQMVFNNNYAANKVDYFLHRRVETSVELNALGNAVVETRIHLRNEAPSGPPSLLLGPNPPNEEDEPGTNRMILNVLLPPGTAVESYGTGVRKTDPFFYRDEDHIVVWDYLELPAGEAGKATVAYELPGAIVATPDEPIFEMTLYPQATVNPDRYEFEVTAPSGFLLKPVTVAPSDAVETFSSSGVLERPTTFSFELVAD